MNFTCLIFDLDGTLVDTIADIAASMNRALAQYNFPPLIPSEYTHIVGWGIRRLAFLALPPQEQRKSGAEKLAAEIAERATRFYAESPLAYSKPYPGIPELMAELRARRLKTAVCTNKPDSVTRLVLQGLFPLGFFDAVRGDTNQAPRKPDPQAVWDILMELDSTPRQTIVIGDSEIDMETAHNANCHALGVSWGFRSRKVLENAGAERIIDKPEELLALLPAGGF
ncbi:MAG: HAD family hydrolase [Spirochaetaceae bacterium]|jgi:phosphoglycolate phosphatase|nr:HAD family hydrolase [Spirochaetaceae bacterium]